MGQRDAGKKPSGRKRILGILLSVALLLSAICLWQRNNLQALGQFLWYSRDELEQQLLENEESAQELLEQVPLAQPQIVEPEPIPEVPSRQKENVETNRMPSEKLPERKPPAELPKEKPARPKQEQPVPAKPPVEKYEQEIAALVERVYVLRKEYTSILDEMHYAAMVEYYTQLSQQRPKSDYLDFLRGFAAQVIQMEKDCDSEIDGILQEMRTLLKKSGKSMKLAEDVAYTYAHEKSTKKAFYMSELREKGLI